MERDRFWRQDIETMARRKLEALQLQRLRWQVERCYRESPFYRERFDRAGVHPRHLQTLTDLQHFPVVTKEELREEQEAHPPFGRYVIAPRADWYELHPSTGTTGRPVNTIWSKQDVQVIADHTARTMWSFGTRSHDIVQNAFSYGLWVAGMAVHYACALLGCFVIPIGAGSTQRQIEYLLSPGSTVLLATPSFALHIAEVLKQRGIGPGEIALRAGCFGGEPGAEIPATRGRIEEGLGIECFDYYGLGEIGPTFASECTGKNGLHWAEDHYYVEVLHPETRTPLPPGEVGVLVMTHLTREATPMVRYWTNDYGKVDLEPCACGRTHGRIVGGILGRADDLIIFRGTKFYPTQVERVVRMFPEFGDEFRIELASNESGADVVTIAVELVGGLDEGHQADLIDRMRRALKEELMVTPQVRLVPYGTLERTVFKARRIVDHRKGHG